MTIILEPCIFDHIVVALVLLWAVRPLYTSGLPEAYSGTPSSEANTHPPHTHTQNARTRGRNLDGHIGAAGDQSRSAGRVSNTWFAVVIIQ